MMRFNLKPLTLAILSASLAVPVSAQTDDDNEKLVLEELVVTARQREETLQEVPVAVNAFTEKDMQRQEMNDMRDLVRMSPGLTYDSSGSMATGGVVIRGMSQPGLIGDETNVAVFVDGVYYSGRDAAFMPLTGLQRVEVLRGPQSALYGRNAFAGAMNYITKKPGSEFEARVEGTYGDHGRQGVNGFISLPMGDMLAARLDAISDRSGSTFEDGDHYLGSIENNSQRLRVMFTPSESLEFDFTYAHIDMQEAPQPGFYIQHNGMTPLESSLGRQPLIPGVNYNPMTGEPYPGVIVSGAPEAYIGEVVAGTPDGVVDGAEGTGSDSDRFNLTINWDIGDVRVSSITGQSSVETRAVTGYNRDVTGTTIALKTAESEAALRGAMPGNPATDYLAIPVATTPSGIVYASGIFEMDTGPFAPNLYMVPTTGKDLGGQPNDDRTDFSQELRIQSMGTDDFQWSAGLLYATTDLDQWTWVSIVDPADPLSAIAIEISDNSVVNGDPKLLQLTEHTNTTRSAFFSVGYDFTDKLNVTLEGRYTQEDKSADNTIDNRAPGILFPTGYAESDWSYFTPRVTATYQYDDETMFYVNLAQGTKSGGINSGASETELFYDPEVNTTFEIGRKKEVLDGRGYFNVAAYYIDWQDQQIRDFSQVDSSGTLPAVIITNLGQSSIWGVELETAFQVSKHWAFHGGYTYNEAKIDKGNLGPLVGFTDYEALGMEGIPFPGCIATVDPSNPCANVTTLVSDGDVSGNQLPNTHRNTLALGVKYSRMIGDLELYANLDGIWKDKRYTDAANTLEIAAFYDVNFQAGLQGENWYGGFWVKNLLDDDTPVTSYRPYSWNGLPYATSVNRNGRMLGMTLGYNF